MKTARYLLALTPLTLMITASVHLCLNAHADELPMQEQQAKMDAVPPPVRPILNGKVSASESGEAAAGQDQNPGSTPSQLNDEAKAAIFQRAGKYLSPSQRDTLRDALNGNARQNGFSLILRGDGGPIEFGARQPKMSNEQFRQMEYGVVGFISTVTIGSANPVVTEVFRNCPAAKAGIKVGDILISAGDHVFQIGDGQRTVWQNVGGKAGTTVDIKILRNGELITFTLIRMNFEDIPDASRRMMYEAYLSRFGPPTGEK